MTGCEALARAFAIFGEYTDARWPTHCEHDVLYVMADPSEVSEEHIAELEELGFDADSDGEFVDVPHFCSFRFGSC